MLRIDVNVPVGNSNGYVVPPSNPFVTSGPAGVLKEIWAFGLRNPWRYSFDLPSRGGTGAIIIGDGAGRMGRGRLRAIGPRRSATYGWRYREGAHLNVTSVAPVYNPQAD